MAIDQKLLLNVSLFYNDALNQEYLPGYRLRPIAKKRFYVCHAQQDFRLVEGLIALLWKAGIDAYFDWNSGFEIGQSKETKPMKVKERLALCNAFIYLATEDSLFDLSCRQELEYATILRKRIYIVSTHYEKKEFGKELVGIYNELAIELSAKESGTLTVRALDMDKRHLWRSVSSANQL